MIEAVSPLILQYGVLGIWTATLLWERQSQGKTLKTERSEHVEIIKSVSVNMALVNDNLKDLKAKISKCPVARGK